MAGNIKPNIITEGLTFYFDAANLRSYTGTGASWRDLTPGVRSMTLTNSPVYSSTFGGGFTFSTASNQSFSIPAVSMTTESFAVDIWFKAGAPVVTGNGYNGILSCGDLYASVGSAALGWGIGMPSNFTSSQYGATVTSSLGRGRVLVNGPNLNTGTLYHLFMQRNTSNETLELYVNGVKHSSGSLSNTASVASTSNITTTTWLYGFASNNNTYYTLKMYVNKVFSTSEIQQNYNAIKGRFGL